MKHIGIYWFNNDPRLFDNSSLHRAASEVDQLLCVYFIDPIWQKPNQYTLTSLSQNRWRFLLESLQVLDKSLHQLNQHLIIHFKQPLAGITELIEEFNPSTIYRSRHAGYYENYYWQELKDNFPALGFVETDSHTLFNKNHLPFPLSELPDHFTQFRKQVEALPVREPLSEPKQIPESPTKEKSWLKTYLLKSKLPAVARNTSLFKGGEKAASVHLKGYFQSQKPSENKEKRNELSGWDNSTKFSPWLANGSLSVRAIHTELRDYEKTRGANESTNWIYYELLWREFFQWYAHRFGKHLYRFQGINNHKPLTSYYSERFQKWCQGNTPYPLVNACMKQLNSTGYMSNRGRQIVASCLVNELQVDWRCGAAYFEQQLLDYDVASNWGNWQYLAGVGADPRGQRHFDLNKQTRQFDPEETFINHWHGQVQTIMLDSVDASDWPIDPDR